MRITATWDRYYQSAQGTYDTAANNVHDRNTPDPLQKTSHSTDTVVISESAQKAAEIASIIAATAQENAPVETGSEPLAVTPFAGTLPIRTPEQVRGQLTYELSALENELGELRNQDFSNPTVRARVQQLEEMRANRLTFQSEYEKQRPESEYASNPYLSRDFRLNTMMMSGKGDITI